MPRIARSDYEDSAKAIAYELPTQAAFSILRATEDLLNNYYEHFIKQNGTKSDKRTWGPMIEQLRRKKSSPKPDEDLLSHLDHIRTKFRNPTDHPDKIYGLDEVQDLFNLCVDVMNRMASVYK